MRIYARHHEGVELKIHQQITSYMLQLSSSTTDCVGAVEEV